MEKLQMLRALDFVLAVLGLVVGLPLLVLVLLVGIADTGSPLFFQTRVGRGQKLFRLVKFRTMKVGTASVATHLVTSSSVTRIGSFLRKSKLDELPQLWNVLWGDMSLVGPRPCLPTQQELVAERAARGVFDIRPGITGLAQVEGIDMSDPILLATVDALMIKTLNVKNYFKYIVQTLIGKGQGDRVR